jgi:dienelactone hydrolase
MRVWIGRVLLFWICLAGAVGAETAQTHQATDVPLDLREASGTKRAWLEAFGGPDETFSYTTALLAEEDEFRIIQVTFPSAMHTPFPMNDSVPGELYLPKHPAKGADGRMPAAIVLDILDGRAVLPRMTARVLAARGVAAFYFPMPYYNTRRPPQNAHFELLDKDPREYIVPPLRQMVMDARRAKVILAGRSDIDPHRIGITGISLGGIMASLAAGVDGTFYRVAPVLAGGDMATLIFHAREMRGLKKILEKHDIDRDAAAALLAPVEPLNFADRIDPHSCLMINADHDEVIPSTATLALSKAIGSPTLLWMPAGHYTGVLFLPNMQQRVADFMLGQKVDALEVVPKK